jgi:hypothetical protein
MNIKQTVAEIRKINNQMRDCKNTIRLVRLSDRLWDLQARYQSLLRQDGLTPVL